MAHLESETLQDSAGVFWSYHQKMDGENWEARVAGCATVDAVVAISMVGLMLNCYLLKKRRSITTRGSPAHRVLGIIN